MIDFPIAELLDDSICLICLERHLRSDGFICSHCEIPKRRLFRPHAPAYRCRDREGYYTLLTGTIFERTRQRPATLVLLRGVAEGEPTARLTRALGLSRKQFHTLQQRLQTKLDASAPIEVMMGTTFETDELYSNAAEKASHRVPTDPPRQRTNKRKGHGACAKDRPPILSVVPRETGEHRFWVCDHADRRTCRRLIAERVSVGRTWPDTDEWQSDRGSHLPTRPSAVVCASGHGMMMAMAGVRYTAISVKGPVAAIRTYLCAFLGVHRRSLHGHVVTYEATLNAKRITPQLIRRMSVRDL